MWVLRGLRNGVLTTRWPGRPDGYADSSRCPAQVIAQPSGGAAQVPAPFAAHGCE